MSAAAAPSIPCIFPMPRGESLANLLFNQKTYLSGTTFRKLACRQVLWRMPEKSVIDCFFSKTLARNSPYTPLKRVLKQKYVFVDHQSLENQSPPQRRVSKFNCYPKTKKVCQNLPGRAHWRSTTALVECRNRESPDFGMGGEARG